MQRNEIAGACDKQVVLHVRDGVQHDARGLGTMSAAELTAVKSLPSWAYRLRDAAEFTKSLPRNSPVSSVAHTFMGIGGAAAVAFGGAWLVSRNDKPTPAPITDARMAAQPRLQFASGPRMVPGGYGEAYPQAYPQSMQPGFVPQGYAPQGYAPQGYAPQGHAPQGFAPPGLAPAPAVPAGPAQADLAPGAANEEGWTRDQFFQTARTGLTAVGGLVVLITAGMQFATPQHAPLPRGVNPLYFMGVGAFAFGNFVLPKIQEAFAD